MPSKKPRLDEAINTLKEISKEVAESPNDNVKPNKALQTHEMIKRDNPAAKSRTSETSGADKNATWPIDGGGKPSHESKVNKTDDAGKNVTESVGGTS